ncbi:MAG: hypothetical protein ACI4SS_06635 [Clostridia bacterium]
MSKKTARQKADSAVSEAEVKTEMNEEQKVESAPDAGETKRIDIKSAQNPPAENPPEEKEETAEAKEESAEAKEEAAEVKAEEAEVKTEEETAAASEKEYSAAEGTDASLLSDFAPKPMNIPNVDLEKEKKKQEKRKQNRSKEVKKVEARKNRGKKKQSVGRKIAAGVASFLIFIVLTAAMTGFISILSVQTVTSKYAFRMAVRNMDIAEITVGSVSDCERLGMNKCSSKAALVDIIRDNSSVSITYKEIISAIRGSGVEDFLAGEMKAASDHLLLGKDYEAVTGSEIAAVIKDNSTLVRNLTGRILTDEDYTNIAAYFEEYGNMEDISAASIDETWLSQYTQYTKHLMSLKILGAVMLICIMLIVLLCVVGRGSAHVPLGWSFILSGIAVILTSIFFRPSYAVNTRFLQTVLDSYFNFFTTAVIVIAGIFTVIGAFIFLIGNASSDSED